MSLGALPNCKDFEKRLDLFLDGEIDGRTMRELALHVARCPSCESGLREVERLQDAVAETVRDGVDHIDVAALWHSVEGRLDARPLPVLARLRERWGVQPAFEMPAMALAAAAAVVLVVAGAIWTRGALPVAETQVTASNKADIGRLSSSASSVAVWTEPRNQTTAIWVSYEP